MHSNGQRQSNGETMPATDVASTIPRISDTAAYRENMVAIDRMVSTPKCYHIIAWGKWLGLTPETVRNIIEAAQSDNAPPDAIQKIDGRWLRLQDIENESNRNCVDDLASGSGRDKA